MKGVSEVMITTETHRNIMENAEKILSRSLLCLLCAVMPLRAQTHWHIEAESPQTRVLLRNDTLDIIAPKGVSLWWNQPLQAPCMIEYQACVVVADGTYDRLSDMNCFWMASNPTDESSPLQGIQQRGGRFVESYRLQCYYLGYGGNYNTTTRFRRYTGDTLAVSDESHRPAILKEYTDSAHLLKPNQWYHIRIEVGEDGRNRFFVNEEQLIDYLDPNPLLKGWFAFRTTWSHTRLTGFRVSQNDKKVKE